MIFKLLALVILFGAAPVCMAAKLSVPAVNTVIKNYADLPPSADIKIEAFVECVGFNGSSCGLQDSVTNPSLDGTFSIPAMEVSNFWYKSSAFSASVYISSPLTSESFSQTFDNGADYSAFFKNGLKVDLKPGLPIEVTSAEVMPVNGQ